jgi:spoIIIJ-associated protein
VSTTNKVTVTAKTIDDAVRSALSQLNTTEDQVNIKVIQEPSKGFLGIGARDAVVEVEKLSIDDQKAEKEVGDQQLSQTSNQSIIRAKDYLIGILHEMGLEVEISLDRDQEGYYIFNLSGKRLGLMIGRRGQTLDSLQYLTNLVANKGEKEYQRIIIDPENYRARRQKTLEELAERLAHKAMKTKKEVLLEPMNPAERKIIHTYLQDVEGISTRSEGEGKQRRIIIYPE